ncbi:MAG: Fur family transcriptional regulator [Phycisphaerae bacterium]
MRMTRQRRVILEQLRKVCTHPTADEVYRMVRRRIGRISLATVYRNLEMLADRGLIRRLDLAGGARRYDGDTKDHYHVRCVRCGRVGDVYAGRLRALEATFGGASDYAIMGWRLELIGLCPRCRRRSAGRVTGSAGDQDAPNAGGGVHGR